MNDRGASSMERMVMMMVMCNAVVPHKICTLICC